LGPITAAEIRLTVSACGPCSRVDELADTVGLTSIRT
jgi:hypothetical protein